MRARTCPTHRAPMHRLIARSASGTEIELDRCGDCGALWFDAGELEQLDRFRARPAGPGFDRICPSCSNPDLDPAVGGHFTSAQCGSCQGTFLDAATVAKLASERLPRLPEAKRSAGELGFVCASCEQRFPYAEANAIARGLVCRDCAKGEGGAKKPELRGVFDAVFDFLTE